MRVWVRVLVLELVRVCASASASASSSAEWVKGCVKSDVNMTSTSGIRASGSGSSEYVKRIVLKDKTSYDLWRTKITAILDAEDSLEIVNGTEIEPREIAEVQDDQNVSTNIAEVEKIHVEIKDWRKRSKKAASLIT